MELKQSVRFGFLYGGNPIRRRCGKSLWQVGCLLAMEAVQVGSSPTAGFASDGFLARKSAHVAPKIGPCTAPCSAWRPQSSEPRGFAWRPVADNGIAKVVKFSRQVTTRVALMRGLGGMLKEGYVLRKHEILDEHTPVQSTGDVIEKLKNGFKNFKKNEYNQKPDLYAKLAEGQEPKVMMITCADSRVCPTMLHGLEAGEAFIVRNVANLVPPCEGSGEHHGTSAAIEFAVTVLQVERIVVMGHSNCGGIRALMTRDIYSGDFVGSWVRIGLPAKEKALSLMAGKSFDEQCGFCEQEAVNVSLVNLLTFPFIEERVKAGKLRIFGMHYDFVQGHLTSWEIEREDDFVHA